MLQKRIIGVIGSAASIAVPMLLAAIKDCAPNAAKVIKEAIADMDAEQVRDNICAGTDNDISLIVSNCVNINR